MRTTVRVMGAENEYALAAFDSHGCGVESEYVAGRLVRQLAARQPTLADCSGGVFLGNGARCYVDCGHHPEYSTPECTDPRELVRHVKAGERLLCEAAREVEASLRGLRVLLFRTNVDHGGAGTTWGAHESYMHRMDSDRPSLIRNLIPHLVSRVIYTGAGGFDPASAGLRFMLSPRALHFEAAVSGDSTRERGIFHTKGEPLAGRGLQRLHVMCGESLGSSLASVLKFGTTALIVALIEEGFRPGEWLSPKYPVAAYHQIAGDLSLARPIELADGRRVTALEMQRMYLAAVRQHLGESFLPDWAPDVCVLWRETLDALERGFEAVVTKLDWAMRYALITDRAARAGLDWGHARAWGQTFESLREAAICAGRSMDDPQALQHLIGPDTPIPLSLRGATRHIESQGLSWDDGREFLRLRSRLFEIDLRFGQLGEEGLFAALEAGGHLSHAVGGVDRVPEAMQTPPADTRASVRGALVRQAPRLSDRMMLCGWDAVWDRRRIRVLDLSDPFQSSEVWRPMTRREARGLGLKREEIERAAPGD